MDASNITMTQSFDQSPISKLWLSSFENCLTLEIARLLQVQAVQVIGEHLDWQILNPNGRIKSEQKDRPDRAADRIPVKINHRF